MRRGHFCVQRSLRGLLWVKPDPLLIDHTSASTRCGHRSRAVICHPSRAPSPDLPRELARLSREVTHPPAYVHGRLRIVSVLECVPVAERRARVGRAAVHAATVHSAEGGRHAGMAGAGRRAAAPARVHRRRVARAMARHLIAPGLRAARRRDRHVGRVRWAGVQRPLSPSADISRRATSSAMGQLRT
jgi:hypothetical protein